MNTKEESINDFEEASEDGFVNKSLQTQNKHRNRIDKLLETKDIRFRGVFSSRTLKVLGFLFLFFAQICLCIHTANRFTAGVPSSALKTGEVLEYVSLLSLPMFLAANFCIIMTSRTQIKRMLIVYSVIAISISLVVTIVFYRYLMGIGRVLTHDNAGAYQFADLVAKKVFGKVINYNVFVDLALFCLFYYFLFFTPKFIKTRKSMVVFRCMSIIPILFAIAASALYGLYSLEKINLPVVVLSIMPCRSITIYAIFFTIAFLVKLRQILFIKWGGTQEEYELYAKSNKSSLEISVVCSAVILFVFGLDFAVLMIQPMALFYGIGLNFYFAFSAPLIMLLSYTKKTKPTIWDYLMLLIFIFAVIILYLETGLYIFKH